MPSISFQNISLVSCGTLSLELNYLKASGFLERATIYYTRPGLHQTPHELEKQLLDQIRRAHRPSEQIIVVYGGRYCYVNSDAPDRTMEQVLKDAAVPVARVKATHCMDMLASTTERRRIALEAVGDENVCWLTPGWIQFRHQVFEGWDRAMANEHFPRHSGGAIVLDAIGFCESYMEKKPYEFLEYSDWMGIPITPYEITLERLKCLLIECVTELAGANPSTE